MKFRTVAAAIVLCSCSTTALALEGPYIGAGAGISLVSHDNSVGQIFGDSDAVGFAWNVNAGYDFDGYRVDAEYGHKWISYALSSGKIQSYMVNGYRDFKVSAWNPFIGAGVGVVKGTIEDEGFVADDSSAAFQFTFGVERKFSERLTGSFYYRYEHAFSDFSDNGNKISYGSANIFTGLRYNF